MVNIRQKGAEAERQVCKMLNEAVAEVREHLNIAQFETRDEIFQRNQMQTAVGGDDITNDLGLSIEVKRQEQLSINTWWRQCCESAERPGGGIPILIYKQNRKAWNVVMNVRIPTRPNDPASGQTEFRATISVNDFLEWFKGYYFLRLQLGENS